MTSQATMLFFLSERSRNIGNLMGISYLKRKRWYGITRSEYLVLVEIGKMGEK